MALTFTKVREHLLKAGRKSKTFEITLDDSYPSGGWPIDPADLELNVIERLTVEGGGCMFSAGENFAPMGLRTSGGSYYLHLWTFSGDGGTAVNDADTGVAEDCVITVSAEGY